MTLKFLADNSSIKKEHLDLIEQMFPIRMCRIFQWFRRPDGSISAITSHGSEPYASVAAAMLAIKVLQAHRKPEIKVSLTA